MPTPPSGGNAAHNAEMARLQSMIASLNARPKVAQFDIMGNYNRAKSAAEAAVNPLYERKWSEFMNAQNVNRAQAQQGFQLSTQEIASTQKNTLEDNATKRTRTVEDVAAALQQSQQQEANYQTDEGEDFDVQYRQLSEELSASGNATTGLGAQAQVDQVRLRNVTNGRQLQEFKDQRSAKELFRDRTIEDIAKGDTRAGEMATQQRARAQFDLDSYMEDLAAEERIERTRQDVERQGEVLQRTGQNRASQIDTFLAGLPGQGYSAADVAATRQAIGG
jgi:hypothetical protein